MFVCRPSCPPLSHARADNDVIIEEILTAGGIDMLVVLADVYDDYCVSKDGTQGAFFFA